MFSKCSVAVESSTSSTAPSKITRGSLHGGTHDDDDDTPQKDGNFSFRLLLTVISPVYQARSLHAGGDNSQALLFINAAKRYIIGAP